MEEGSKGRGLPLAEEVAGVAAGQKENPVTSVRCKNRPGKQQHA